MLLYKLDLECSSSLADLIAATKYCWFSSPEQNHAEAIIGLARVYSTYLTCFFAMEWVYDIFSFFRTQYNFTILFRSEMGSLCRSIESCTGQRRGGHTGCLLGTCTGESSQSDTGCDYKNES
jgi:hypothetical protein